MNQKKKKCVSVTITITYVRIEKSQQTHILVMTIKVLVFAEKINSGAIKCMETYRWSASVYDLLSIYYDFLQNLEDITNLRLNLVNF